MKNRIRFWKNELKHWWRGDTRSAFTKHVEKCRFLEELCPYLEKCKEDNDNPCEGQMHETCLLKAGYEAAGSDD